MQHQCDLTSLELDGVWVLIGEMGEGHNRFGSSDEFKTASKAAVSKTCFDGRMGQNFNLGNPISNPEIRVVLIRNLEVIFQTPDDSASNSFETIINCMNRPILPKTNSAKGNVDHI